MKFSKVFFFGKPLANEVQHTQRLRKLKALPILSSDALSSVAYGTEEILRVLILAGAAALCFSMPIALAICGLIAILGASYWQTIEAYPSGGGAFTVARENLGVIPGLLAGTALLLDYLLTVAVSVSAGIRALTSAFPELIPWTVTLCILSIGFITWMNLRGVKESATVFAFPTYLFIVLVLLLIGTAFYQSHFGNLAAGSVHVKVHRYDGHLEVISIILLLRAFSAGCSALTGIECVANSVPIFKPSEVKNARKTLLMMVTLLGIMFLGISYLASALHIHPNETESVLSQIAHRVFGDGLAYYALQASTTLILLLAANTAFTGFPMLASVLSNNKFLPKQLSNLGDRLAFSNGIILLAVLSCLLIILFQGDTHALIPLYSVGVFLAFSLSQLGMVRRWLKRKGKHYAWKAFINFLGFLVTSIALLVIIESKFEEGAWITAILIPLMLIIFNRIYQHYTRVDKELAVTPSQAKSYLNTYHGRHSRPKVIVPISKIHRGTLAALDFARSISNDVTVVNIEVTPEKTQKLQEFWQALALDVNLVTLTSPYRSTIGPLKKFIHEQDTRAPERGLAIIVLPMAIPTRWWHYLLHNQRATLLKASLYYDKKHKGSTRIVVDVPYHLRHS